jgi:hypothetical protein
MQALSLTLGEGRYLRKGGTEMAVHDNDRRDMNRLTQIAICLGAAFIVGTAGRLRKLIFELPEGNVVRTTGQSFLDAVANGQALSSRLHFVGPTR